MNQPISEQYRLAARDWVEADSAANLLEETKSAVLSEMMIKLGDIPVSRAEMKVKASGEWVSHVNQMVFARRKANGLKVEMEYLRMRFSEWQSENANRRAEMRL